MWMQNTMIFSLDNKFILNMDILTDFSNITTSSLSFISLNPITYIATNKKKYKDNQRFFSNTIFMADSFKELTTVLIKAFVAKS